MSTINQTAGPSRSDDNFTVIFQVAMTEYETVTGKPLHAHPFAMEFDSCHSPQAVSTVLRTQAKAFSRSHNNNEKLMRWLDPIVHIIFTFSATLGGGIGLKFPPAQIIFTAIGVLVSVTRDVVADHKKVIQLFERIHLFLQRLNNYIGTPLTREFMELLGKIMAQTLSILALSTNTMTEGWMKKFGKKLIGRTGVEDAVLRLDLLTKEESLMAVATILEVADRVDGNVEQIKSLAENTDGNVEQIKALAESTDDNVEQVKVLAKSTGSNIEQIKVLVESTDDNVEQIKALAKSTDGRAEEIDHTMKAVEERMDEQQRNQMQKELRTWLSPPDSSINHNTARETQHDGTATWFIQSSKFLEWKSNGSLLWVNGNPGAGKSILCSAIIEDIKKSQGTSALVAYHYFDYKDEDKRHVRGLLTSVLFQLSADSDRCRDILHQLYETCRDGTEKPGDSTLAHCLKTLVRLPGQLPIFIIMDALDECPNNTGTPSARDGVLDFVEDLVGSGHSNLFICITSRPEQDIQSVLNPLTSASRRVALHEELGQRKDIYNFVRSFVKTDRAMRRWKEEDKELVINTLCERAGGMFRWVYCQLDALRRCFPSSIRKTLSELPTTLDETYVRTLEGIPKQKRQHAHRLFQCLVAAIRPLRVEELGEIFAIDFGQGTTTNFVEGWRPEDAEDAILSACSTLITIIKDKGQKVIQFCHFSVKEFLTSDRLRASEVVNLRHYYILLDSAHYILAQACLTVLLQLDEKIDKKRLVTFPLAWYAAQHWFVHAKNEDVSLRVQDTIEQLFDPIRPYLAAWVWIYNAELGQLQQVDDLADRPSLPEASALYYAVSYGLCGVAKYLISTHGEDVNAKCGIHGSPLHAASRNGDFDTVSLLLDYGADVNITNESKITPLYVAYDGQHLEVMQLLLECGAAADGNYDKLGLLIHDASYNRCTEVIRLLLHHNADVNAISNANLTPLHWALYGGHVDVAQILLEHGADVNAVSDYGTALYVASHYGRLEVVRLLLEHGADVHIPGPGRKTPLQAATWLKHTEVVQLLLEHGADKEYDGRSNC